MDVEELPEEPKPVRNQTTDLSRLSLTKQALYGRNSSSQQPAPVALQQPTLTYQPQQSHVSRPQYQPVAFPQPQPAFMSSHQSAAVNPQSGGTPPLFVGFLTNDVSMNQIRDLFTSYTKAANDAKADYRLTDRKSTAARRGRFDVRQLDDSDSEEEEENLGKRDLKAKRRRDGKTAKDAVVGIDKDVIKKAAVKLKTDESSGVNVPATGGLQENSKKTGLFDIKKPSQEMPEKKNSFSFNNDTQKEDKPSLFKQTEATKSGLFDAAEKTTANSQTNQLTKGSFLTSSVLEDIKKKPSSPVGKQPTSISLYSQGDQAYTLV